MSQHRRIQTKDKSRLNKRKKQTYTSAENEISRWLARRIKKALKGFPVAETAGPPQ